MKNAITKAIEGGYHHTGGGWNKGLRMRPLRACEECGVANPAVSFYQKWQKLLCSKHYWHYYKYGKALWGAIRPYITPEPRREKHLQGVGIAWRKAVFERDNYTCQECGVRGVEIQADNIKPFKYFPELRWVLSNGRTLCVPCHRKTDTYGRRGQKLYAKSI